MYQHILVPWDGSPSSAAALSVAAGIAARQGAAVTVVHVHEPPPILGTAPMYDTRLDAELRNGVAVLERALAQREGARSHVPIEPVFLDGQVISSLVTYAEKTGPDLVVMSTHGRGAFARLWLGSVTDALVRLLHVAVLVIPGRHARADGTGASATSDDAGAVDVAPDEHGDDAERLTAPFGRVLLPLDGSSDAETALLSAVALTMPGDAHFLLLRVIPPRDRGHPRGWQDTSGTASAPRSADEAAARGYLRDVAESLRAVGVRATPNVVESASPAAGILTFVRDEPVDVIALAPRRTHRLSEQLLGSVTDKVLRTATRPVLLHHHAPAAPRAGNRGVAWHPQHVMPRAGDV